MKREEKQRKEERRDNRRVQGLLVAGRMMILHHKDVRKRGYSSHLVNLEKSTFERDVASFNLDC